MEDANGVNDTASPAEQQNIPKYRLDEEIARNRALQAQVEATTHLLRQMAPNVRQQAPEQEPAALRELKETNPQAYQLFKQQDAKLKQASAATFQTLDRQDRMEFQMEFGEEGKKLLPVVEQKLEELRQRGIHNFNRGQIFVHLAGMDAIQKKRAPAPASAAAQIQAATQKAAAEVLDAPTSDVKAAGIAAGSSASAGQVSESLDDLEKRLEGMEF